MITVWLVWEFAERPEDLRALLRSYVAGSWVLAMLTLANLNSPESADQVRFAAAGQDPNDVARFLDLGFPMAALLLDGETHWTRRVLAAGYLPLGFAGVLLTASRGGFLAAIVGLAGCAVLLLRHHARAVLAGALALPAVVVALWFVMPRAALQRILTIPEQLQRGDLNQRLNIWAAGWQAFVHAPFFGTGTGTFVAAAGVAPIDTAHNTVLSIAVEGGVCTLLLAAAIVVAAACLVLKMTGAVRIAMATGLLVWLTTSLVATVEESRTTWLLLALIALAARLADEDPGGMTRCFAPPVTMAPLAAVLEP
jgi:O-antigen ligase